MKYTNVNIKSIVRAEDLFAVIYINSECDYYEYYSSKREFDIFAKYLAGGDFGAESVHIRVMARSHAEAIALGTAKLIAEYDGCEMLSGSWLVCELQ